MSASPSAKAVQTIGETSGLMAQAATPTFDQLSVTSTPTGTTDGTTNADLDTAIKITIIPATGHGGIDATNLQRAAVKLTDLTDNKVYQSIDTSSKKSELQRLKTSGGGGYPDYPGSRSVARQSLVPGGGERLVRRFQSQSS